MTHAAGRERKSDSDERGRETGARASQTPPWAISATAAHEHRVSGRVCHCHLAERAKSGATWEQSLWLRQKGHDEHTACTGIAEMPGAASTPACEGSMGTGGTAAGF